MQWGQGASEALPVWAVYMQKAYANKAINISQGDFEKPDKPLTIELDCDKYKENNNSGSEMFK
jgi:penicillin-binding protein 1A